MNSKFSVAVSGVNVMIAIFVDYSSMFSPEQLAIFLENYCFFPQTAVIRVVFPIF
jgi:hypothetical protein